jgi:hypothetical protein
MNIPSNLKLAPSPYELIINLSPDAIPYHDLKHISEIARQSIKVSRRSYYRDNIWDLSEEYPELRPADVKLSFKKITFGDGSNITDPEFAHYLSLTKEYFYSLLVDPPASRPKWSTCCSSMRRGIKFLILFMQIQKIVRFSDLLDSDISNFLEWLAKIPHKDGKVITNRTLFSRVARLSWLYEQSHKLSDGLIINPFNNYHTENEWCKHAAHKVIPREHIGTIEMPDEVAKQLITCAISDLKIADTVFKLRKDLKIYKQQGSKKRSKTDDNIDLTNNSFPWHKYGISNGTQLKSLEARVSAAGYIIIAIFTGMRIHEVLNIKAGIKNNFITEDIKIDGGIKQLCFVISKTTKLEANATEYQWQTIPIVEKAIRAVEKILQYRHAKGNPYLFASYQTNNQATASKSMNGILKKYIKTHNITFDKKTWDLKSHQFRKKFARIMVRQGLGLKELQDQLKHYDIEMTKIYGDLNLYSELQKEKFTLSEELYEEFLGSHIPIIGGGSDEIQELRKQFLGMAKKDRKVFLNSLPKKALIEQTDDGLCMYRPKKSLCGGDKQNCRPADCNNSIIPAVGVTRNLQWRKQENERMLLFFKNHPLKVAHLTSRVEEINKLLSQLNSVRAP